MKNKKCEAGGPVRAFFERFRLEECRHISDKVKECVKSRFARKRKKDKIQIRPRHKKCISQCTKKKVNL